MLRETDRSKQRSGGTDATHLMAESLALGLIHKANKFGGPIPLPDQIQQQLADRFGHGRLDN